MHCLRLCECVCCLAEIAVVAADGKSFRSTEVEIGIELITRNYNLRVDDSDII